ncbi:MAG: hypothetical protein M1531_09750 [Chloroflexi bacterium]|nr:hypothetical protein [Chloroflexota bacterium]
MPTLRPGTWVLLCLAITLGLLLPAIGGEASRGASASRVERARLGHTTAGVGPLAGKWDSGIAIQNLYPAPQSIAVEFYDDAGMRLDAATVSLPLPAYGSETIWLPSVANLPDGNYAAVIDAEQPVAYVNLVVNQENHMGDAFTNSSPAYRLELPLVYRWGGTDNAWYTKLTIHNAGTSATRPLVRFYGPASDAALLTYLSPDTIPPSATRTFDLTAAEFAALGDAFTGGTSINADQPLIALAAHCRDDAFKMLAFGTGTDATSAAMTLLAPLVYKNASDGQGTWRSTLQVKNSSSFTARVRIAYRPAGKAANDSARPWQAVGDGTSGPLEYSIPANAVLSIDPQSALQVVAPSGEVVDLPDGFQGSAVVESLNGAAITGIVSAASYDGGLAGAYNMFGAGQASSRLALPLLYNNFDNGSGRWASTLQVQNTSTTQEAKVVVTYRASTASAAGGGPWRAIDDTGPNSGEVAIPPAGTVTFRLAKSGVIDPSGAVGNIPEGFLGSATLESTNGVKIVGAAVTTNYDAGIGVMYNGFSY